MRFSPHFLLVNPVYAHCLGRRALELGVNPDLLTYPLQELSG